jgi:hypothetical protein
MSRFNIRPIGLPKVVAEAIPADKKPSAYNAMKHGTAAPVMSITPAAVEEAKEAKKKGRPSKDELRKRKMELASGAIASLLSSTPKKSDVRDYMQHRIEQLNEEKR